MVRLCMVMALAGLAGCAEYAMSGDVDWTDTGAPPATTGPGEPEPPPGPEIENDFLGEPPASTAEYVFIANSARDTVTRIRAADQDVITTEVGRTPSLIRTTPDGLTAVSFNRGDDTVSIIDVESMMAVTLEIRDDFNTMEMTPDGRFVLLWHDGNAASEDDPPSEGLQSYNEISVVDLVAVEHTPMAVGFNPRDVDFTSDSSVGVVVSDDALAIIDFTVLPLDVPTIVPLSPDLIDPPDAEEVRIEPTGQTAFVRRFDADVLQAVDLGTLEVTDIPVGEGLTDMDLSANGEFLAVVCRDAREIWVIRPDSMNTPPRVLPFPDDLPLGALMFSPTGGVGIVYTTASLVDRYIHWDILAETLTTKALVKPVSALSIAPSGDDMLIIHTREDAADAELGPFFGEWALTMVDLDTHLPTPMRLPAAPVGFANAPGGRLAYFIMEDQPFLEVLDYHTRLYEEVPLRSTPVWVGALPDATPGDADLPYAWVSQVHELGRISFYDPDDGAFETLTGFELNAAIED